MKTPASSESSPEELRERLIGLGETSISKSYYPELRQRLSELERFRALLDRSNDAIFLVEAGSGLLHDATGAADALLGGDAGRFLGKPFADILAPGAAERLARLYAGQASQDSLQTLVYDSEAHSGPGTPVEINLRVVELGKECWAVAAVRDIADRLRAEKALRLAEEKYRGIFENAVEGLFQSDRRGRFTSANPALAAMLGYPSAEVLMREVESIGEQLYLDPVDRETLLRRLDEYGFVRDVEVRLRRRDGRAIWASVNVRAVPDETGDVSLLEGSCEDVTVRKEAEEILVAAKRELERRVGERTRDLTRANEQLRLEARERRRAEEAALAANRTKSEFLSMVSHEIRTPLTSILGFAKIIMKKLTILLANADVDVREPAKARAASQIMENLNIIASEGERLKALINDVLDIAKLEAGGASFKKESFRPEALLAQVAAASGPLFVEGGVSLKVEAQEDLPELVADRDRIIQVLVNLVSNAVKFTTKGRVTCRVNKAEGGVVFSVADTGVGIEEKDYPKVFDKYAQIGEHLTDKPKGTGLGLPICKNIVEGHGGRIWFTSRPGIGSAFSFFLPVA